MKKFKFCDWILVALCLGMLSAWSFPAISQMIGGGIIGNTFSGGVVPNPIEIQGVLGTDKVTNGGFGSDTGWTKGANWTIAGGVAAKSATASNNLSQDCTEVAGETYKVVWDLVSVSGGNLTMSIGSVSGPARSTAGTYTSYITAIDGGNLTFTPSAAGVACSIDNVSVKKVTSGTLTVEGLSYFRSPVEFDGKITLNRGNFTISAGQLLLSAGTATAPPLCVYNAASPDTTNYERLGIYWWSNILWIEGSQAGGTGTARELRLRGAGLRFLSHGTNNVGWQITTSGNLASINDGSENLGESGGYPGSVYAKTSFRNIGGNAQSFDIKYLTELTTIAAAASTDTTIQIPANVIVKAVSVRTTVIIPDTTNYTVTGATSTTVFNTAAVSSAANSTNKGNLNCPYNNTAAQSIRITPNTTPSGATGKVRVTIHYEDITPPTS